MAEKSVQCEFLVGRKLCNAVIENDEAKRVREESCVNEQKDSCCYLCAEKTLCEISCGYLDTPVEKAQPEVETKMDAAQEFAGEYLGGHPAFPKKSRVHLSLEEQDLVISEMEVSIPYRNIKRIESMTKEKITAARVLFLGIVGALWKKEQLYMVLTYKDGASRSNISMIFKLDEIEKAQPSIYQRMIDAKSKKMMNSTQS